MPKRRKFGAAVLGAGTAASWLSVCTVAGIPSAQAAAAPGQDVLNDWGQSAAEVTVEVSNAVDNDTRVVAARTRYLKALAAYATIKKTQASLTGAALLAIQPKVYSAACEVVASQLALSKLVTALTASVRSNHYIKAPYVTIPSQPVNLVASGSSGQVQLSWDLVGGAAQYRIYRDGTQIATTTVSSYLDTGLDNGTAYAYQVRAVNVAGWSPRSIEAVGVPTPATPDTPTQLVAAPADGIIYLQWSPATSATGYQLYRDGVLIASQTSTVFADTGLTDGTSYSYAVEAVNGSAVSPRSDAIVATPVATAPDAPSGLVGAPGNGQVTLSWNPVNGATSYLVMRDGVALGNTSSPGYSDTGLTNGQTYTYVVFAYRLNSPASLASAPVTVAPVAPPLSTPTAVAATPGDGQVSLTWGAVSGATSYRVYRDATLVASPGSTSYTDTGLTNGTSYSYTIVAVSSTSSSAASAPATATPAAAAPGAPSGLSGQAGDATATLSWNPVSGATAYNVYRGGVLRTTVGTTGFTDTGLTNATAYSFYVTAVKSGVESAASSTITVTPAAVVPGTPTGIVAAPGNATVTVSWTASANAQSYRVYRGGVLVGSPSSTSFTDTGLTNGASYSYTVVAVNGTATSAASAPVTATPMAPAPSAPTGLAATAGNAQVALTWNASATATSYRVYRGGVLVGSPTATSWTDTGLTNGTTYSYYVVAVTATTPSTASTTVTATPVKPPVNGTFTGAVASIANGHGTLKVVIVVTNNVITSATGTLLTNDGTETVNINNTAIPQYNSKTVTANSVNITKVSGATLTWAAYKTSLQSALTQAGL